MPSQVTVFGSVNLDLIVQVPQLPKPGETVTGGSFLSAPGGKGANQALAAARAGAATVLIGAVGEDAFADQSLPLLQAAKVNLDGLLRLPQPTGTALILVEESGENLIAVASGANYALASDALPAMTLGPDEVLLSQLEMDLAVTAEVLRRAKAAGARVLLNLAPFRPEAAAFLANADALILNQGEAQTLATEIDLEPTRLNRLAPALAEATASDVVITLGAEGLVAQIGGKAFEQPAFPVSVIDTVGAGDAFCGYLAESLARRGCIDARALRYAAAAGSLTCTRSGAQTAIPPRPEVEALLD